MEMELVVFESFSMAEKGCDSCEEARDAGLFSEMCMAMATQKPAISSLSSLLEYLLDMALARFMPRHRDVEMGESFLATADGKEVMMFMLKPVNACLSMEKRHGDREFSKSDMETEMVSQMDLEI